MSAADRDTRDAAFPLALALPGDTVPRPPNRACAAALSPRTR